MSTGGCWRSWSRRGRLSAARCWTCSASWCSKGNPCEELLLNAIRYGEQPEVRARLDTAVDQALDREALQDLLEERQLVHDAIDATRVQRVRQEMERAEARRLQPHYIESFFHEAFRRLGGSARQREARRYQVSHAPALVRSRDRLIGAGEPVLPCYEPGQPLAAFVCPGHPLLDAVIDLTLERHGDLLKRGAVLVDERHDGTLPRVLFSIEPLAESVIGGVFFTRRRRSRDGQLAGGSVRRMVVAVTAGEPESVGFMRPSCRL